MMSLSDILIISFASVLFSAAVLFFYSQIGKKAKTATDERQNQSIQDLERRLTDLMNFQLKEIRGTVDGSSREMMNQVRSFTKETTDLKNDLKSIHEKVGDLSSFQDIFKSPKLRGQWGEASLEHILSQHYPQELYQLQYLFPSGQQVDAIIKFPNGKILSIDAKFSSQNFERMINADTGEEKELYRHRFIEDTKTRVKEIASKYILPSEGTLDLAIMYIPAEAIYYEIMFNLAVEDIAQFAWKNKVILTSPNTIYLSLRTIEHWFRDLQFSKKTQEIIKRFERISRDAEVLSDEFRKLGRHISDTSSAYERSEKRLSLFKGRVDKLIQIGSPEEKKQLQSGED